MPARPIENDIRERIVRLRRGGWPRKRIASRVFVSLRTVDRVCEQAGLVKHRTQREDATA